MAPITAASYPLGMDWSRLLHDLLAPRHLTIVLLIIALLIFGTVLLSRRS